MVLQLLGSIIIFTIPTLYLRRRKCYYCPLQLRNRVSGWDRTSCLKFWTELLLGSFSGHFYCCKLSSGYKIYILLIVPTLSFLCYLRHCIPPLCLSSLLLEYFHKWRQLIWYVDRSLWIDADINYKVLRFTLFCLINTR